jgi:hypothetical protein
MQNSLNAYNAATPNQLHSHHSAPRNRYTLHLSPNATHFTFTAPYSAFLKFQAFAATNCPYSYMLLLNSNIPTSTKATINATFLLLHPANTPFITMQTNLQQSLTAFLEISNINPSSI